MEDFAKRHTIAGRISCVLIVNANVNQIINILIVIIDVKPKPANITVTASNMIATESVVMVSVFVIQILLKALLAENVKNIVIILLIAIRLSSVLIIGANLTEIIDILKVKTSVWPTYANQTMIVIKTIVTEYAVRILIGVNAILIMY
jgi:hypothetical protein